MKINSENIWILFISIAIIAFIINIIYLFNFNILTLDTKEDTIKILFFVGNLSTFISGILFFFGCCIG